MRATITLNYIIRRKLWIFIVYHFKGIIIYQLQVNSVISHNLMTPGSWPWMDSITGDCEFMSGWAAVRQHTNQCVLIMKRKPALTICSGDWQLEQGAFSRRVKAGLRYQFKSVKLWERGRDFLQNALRLRYVFRILLWWILIWPTHIYSPCLCCRVLSCSHVLILLTLGNAGCLRRSQAANRMWERPEIAFSVAQNNAKIHDPPSVPL